MHGVDPYYTPDQVARLMTSAEVIPGNPVVVADFSAGDGQLLRAAVSRWPNATVVASDIDQKVVKQLGQRRGWKVGRADFLNEASRRNCRALRASKGHISLVLLNPPFSCRGARTIATDVLGPRLRTSPAVAFLLNAVPYLSEDGVIVAVIPAGSLSSQRDRAGWQWLRTQFKMKVIGVHGRDTFKGCFPRTNTIRLVRRKSQRRQSAPPQDQRTVQPRAGLLTLTRGAVPMYTVNGDTGVGTVPIIHSVHLRDQAVGTLSSRVKNPTRIISGPVVLLPRVGRPTKSKVCLSNVIGGATLSDCVYAIGCESMEVAIEVHTLLLKEWDLVTCSYGGTCAPFLTVESLRRVLSALGYVVRP